jgi:diguanylate cyclase (GGDEF)-like protein
MQRNGLTSTQSLDAAAWRWAFGSGSLFRGDVFPLSLFKVEVEKGTFDQVYQTLLSEANQELATLLQEVGCEPDTALRATTQRQPSSELLRRAVECAVKQYFLRAELSNLALTDELTSLYNRRGFHSLAERLLKLGRRSGRGMLLFFIDVDGLKRINDSFGHSEGDLALTRTAEALRKTFRGSDVFARLGGDEFAALAIEASGHSEATIIARLRRNLEAVNINESRYLLSVSLGVVRFDPRTTISLAQLMLQADLAMYEAK